MTWWIHCANALYLVSYAVKEILWLRWITCIASSFTLLALMRLHAPWQSVAWQIVFFVINLGRLIQLIHERSPVKLDADARQLARSVFGDLRARELVRLLAVGQVVEHPAGTQLVRKGEPLDTLSVIVTGSARVELREGVVELTSGAFIGELSYMTRRKPRANVIAATSVRVVIWPSVALRDYLREHPETRSAIQHVLGADLATKLRGVGESQQARLQSNA
jgi:hypothetical protein